MLLLTGATGTVGRPLLARLVAARQPVRCLVRDPGRLGGLAGAGGVEIVVGDLAQAEGFAGLLRGVDTVVHLAAPLRDQPAGSIEALTADATARLLAAAEAAGVRRFLFFSVLGAADDSPARLLRAKAVAERAVVQSPVASTVFAPGWIYDREDPFVVLTRRLARLPVVLVSGSGRARFQPIWAEDVADCVVAALALGERAAGMRLELAGPEVLSYEEIVRVVAGGRSRPVVHVPLGVVRAGLGAGERVLGGRRMPATWEEAQLLELTLLSERGDGDVRRLGVRPRALRDVLGEDLP